jgi:hypothetical protein
MCSGGAAGAGRCQDVSCADIVHTRERDACSRPCAGPSRARDAHVVPDGGTVGEQQEFRNANVTYQEFRNANVTYKDCT